MEELKALARELQGQGAVIPVCLDVANARKTLEIIRAIDDACGGLELVIANAAVALETPGDTLLEGMRIDLAPRGVKVTTIHPGFVRTPGTAGNTFKMPFLLELDDAVERIGRAILRGTSELSFPWQAAMVVKLSRLLPNALWDRAARSLGPGGE
jgi:short-subunit dehydrogenase